MKHLLLWLLCLVPTFTLAQQTAAQYPVTGTVLPSSGGSVNIMQYGAYGDTYKNQENVSCTSGSSVITIPENLATSPYGSGTVYAVVGGCGPLSAQNLVGGFTAAQFNLNSGGTGYNTATAAPGVGDYVVISGGTPVNGSTFTGDIDSDGILTVSGITGSEYIGTVIGGTGVGNAVVITNFLQGPTLTAVPTGGAGTYQTSSTASTTVTFTGSVGGATTGTLNAGITNGTYTFKFSTGDKRSVVVTGTTTATWTTALPVGTITTATYGVIQEAMTGTNRTVVKVLTTAANPGAATAAAIISGGQYSTAPGAGAGTCSVVGVPTATTGTYTSTSLTGGTGTGAQGTVTVVAGVITSVLPTSIGSGYVINDVLSFTVTGGSGTCKVLALSQSQLATSGSGSGLQLAPVYVGLPLVGQVASVSGSTFTFTSVTASTTLSVKSEWFVIGHPDDVGMAAALATNPSQIIFPLQTSPSWALGTTVPLGYSFRNPYVLPNTAPFTLTCNGSGISATGPMGAQFSVLFQSNTSLLFNNVIDNCQVFGFGQSNYGLYLSAAHWLVKNSLFRSNLVANLLIGDAATDNAADNVINNTVLHNDLTIVPAGTGWNYYLSSGSADNKFHHLNADNSIFASFEIDAADDICSESHGFANFAGQGYLVNATKTHLNGCIEDTPAPGQACYYWNGSTGSIDGAQCAANSSTYAGQYGEYIVNDSHNCFGSINGTPNTYWVGNTANLSYQPASVPIVYNRWGACAGNGYNDTPGYFSTLNTSGNTVINGNLTVNGTNNINAGAPLLQSSIPFGVPATTVWDTTGDYVIGASPATSANITFGATSGATTATCSAACFNGANTTNDVNRVITVLDTTYKTCLVTGNSGSSTTIVQCTLSGTLTGTTFTNANAWISGSGTAAQSNGAPAGANVTYPAALSNLYTGIYLYFSGTTAGPPQGIYWCVPASLATGTCYGGVNSPSYSTGNPGTLTGAAKPVIPGSTSALTTTSGTNVPTTGAAIVLPQATLLANTLGTAGCLDYDATAISTSSAVNTKALSVRLNTSGSVNSLTTQSIQRISSKMCNAGLTNSQVSLMQGTGSASQNVQDPTATTSVNRVGVNTANNQTVSFSFNLSATTDSAVLEQYYIKATPGP